MDSASPSHKHERDGAPGTIRVGRLSLPDDGDDHEKRKDELTIASALGGRVSQVDVS